MATAITLASQRLQITVNGVLTNSVTYTNIDSINFIQEKPGQQMNAGLFMAAPTFSSGSQYQLEIVMRDGRREYIKLGGLTGDGATWANSYAGFAIAENAIYSAFP
jgi:hypothetical protein